MWLKHETFQQLVKDSWIVPLQAGNPITRVIRKLKRLKLQIKTWNKDVFKNFKVAISVAKQELLDVQMEIQNAPSSGNLFEKEVQAQLKLNLALKVEADYMRQKNRAQWLHDGDSNSKFFHRINARKKCQVEVSKMMVGDEITDNQGRIGNHVVNYFSNLFSEVHNATSDLSMLDLLQVKQISEEQRASLDRPPWPDEIKQAVFALSGDSVPGPDGFSGSFFHSMWHIIDNDVTNAVMFFFKNHFIPIGLNSSFVILIPKCTDAIRIEQYRPIVLANFLFKIITKIIATRFGSVLKHVLSEFQYGFVPGKQISECVCLVSEGVNALDYDKSCGGMALKLDIAKAFDTVSWSFLLHMLDRMGFSASFVNCIKSVLDSARLSVLVNGYPYGFFACGRGVRQGDPLSPLLFCVVEECFTLMVDLYVRQGNLILAKANKLLYIPPCALYSDDVVFFMKATRHNASMLIEILDSYADMSGQTVNPSKSKVFFSCHVNRGIANLILQDLGFVEGVYPFVYLGVPVFKGAPKAAYLQVMAQSVSSKFSNWIGSTLSMAGRICMVNSVISPSLIHALKIYRWPKLLLKKLEQDMRNFIWSGSVFSKGKCNVVWSKVCAPRDEGGLGVRSLCVSNNALLFKTILDIFSSNSAACRFIQHRYFKFANVMRAHYVPSSIGAVIKHYYSSIVKSTRWLASRHSGVYFYLDNWLGYIIADRLEIPLNLRHYFVNPISDFFFDNQWHIETVFASNFPLIVQDLLRYDWSVNANDELIWVKSLHGSLSSKLAYYNARPHFPEPSWAKWIWASYIPPSRSCVAWKGVHNKLLDWKILRSRGYEGPSVCVFCKQAEDTIDHLFISCSLSNSVLVKLLSVFDITISSNINLMEFMLVVMNVRHFSPRLVACLKFSIITYLWLVWMARNSWLFDNVKVTSAALTVKLFAYIRELDSFDLGCSFDTDFELNCLKQLNVRSKIQIQKDPFQIKWLCPQPGWCKCNMDGSAIHSRLQGAAVFRDHLGSFLGGFTSFHGNGWAFEAELGAALVAIETAKIKGYNRIWFETDSTYVAGLFNNPSPKIPWRFRDRFLLAKDFLRTVHWIFSHVFREANSVADALASIHTTLEVIWYEEPPPIIINLMAKDITSFYYRFP